MASKGSDNRSAKSVLKPSVAYDNFGCYICVSCGSYTAQFYLDKFDESKRSLGKCILLNGSWFTPSEFESHCGKKSKKWKQSIMHSGKSLSEYSLSCPPKQGAKQVSGLVDNQTHCVLSQDCSTTAVSPLVSLNSSQLSKPLLVNTVLSFIKAYRLRVDNESLKKRVVSTLVLMTLRMQKRCCGIIVDKILKPLAFHTTRVVILIGAAK